MLNVSKPYVANAFPKELFLVVCWSQVGVVSPSPMVGQLEDVPVEEFGLPAA